jgi:hypothetical protein
MPCNLHILIYFASLSGWLFLSSSGLAQNQNTPYRSSENVHYWKNRKPHAAYWQQDISYKIKADINEETDVISGSLTMDYFNNSPDTLRYVFFHLYQNAFQPGSYLDQLQKQNRVKAKYGKYEAQNLGTEVKNLKVNDRETKSLQDNTILKVWLNEPLLPGASVKFSMDFDTYFDYGSTRRRMKAFNAFGYKHYDGVHWYPRISVYDHKFGWDTQQHLGKEFYGEYGEFEVELTFASNFVVDATGWLMNEKEVMPAELREKLDIRNFKDKPWNSKPSVIIPYEKGKRKTWKYRALNVHDFAFTADPTYRIGEAEWNGIKTIALAQEPHASRWQNAAEYAAKIIEVYSRDFGMYLYPKMIVADARDGMEYPMLTLDGGADPDYRGLLAHEIGHNWFFGMVGNNETYRAFLDEGFTQFLTAWALINIDGDTLVTTPPSSKYQRNHTKPQLVRELRVYNVYMADAVRDLDPPLNVHSDDFGGALGHGGGYRQVYYKTAVMLYNLQYVLGDELFLSAMQNYFEQWKLCHPYPEDFRNSVIQFTKADLNWFFDQWIETSKKTDYKIACVKRTSKDNHYKIKFKRVGEMQMPIDFSVKLKNDSLVHFYIPNTWFEKSTPATLLPKWTGWGKLNPVYTAEIKVPERITEIMIDPSGRLADINHVNNTWRRRDSFTFDHRVYNYPDRFHYEWFARPDIWWNGYDGLKAGFHINGNYMNYKNVLNATVWFNFGMLQTIDTAGTPTTAYDILNYNLSYVNPVSKLGKNVYVDVRSRYLEGLHLHQAGLFRMSADSRTKFYSFVKGMYRPKTTSLIYLLNRDGWEAEQLNLTLNTGIEHNYSYPFGQGLIKFNVRAATPFSDYSYSQASLTVLNKNRLGKIDINTRAFAQVGSGNIPRESALYVAGANPEELMENKFTRSIGFVPGDWAAYGLGTNHFHHTGGMNLRGYAGYVMPVINSEGLQETSFITNSGASTSIELAFDRLIPVRNPRIKQTFDYDLYLFTDAGLMGITNLERFDQSDLFGQAFRMNAGIGTTLTIKKWGPVQKIDPLTIRADFPLFLSNVPFVEDNNFQFRWLIGVSKTF